MNTSPLPPALSLSLSLPNIPRFEIAHICGLAMEVVARDSTRLLVFGKKGGLIKIRLLSSSLLRYHVYFRILLRKIGFKIHRA